MRKLSKTAPLIGISLAIVSMSGMADSVAHASADDERPLFSAELQALTERIREYFADRLRRMEVVATTVTKSGQTIDWIVPQSQSSDGTLAPPPPLFDSTEAPDLAANLERKESQPKVSLEQSALTEVQAQPFARGPDGLVPVVRFDVERYLASVKNLPKDPRDLLKKLPPLDPLTSAVQLPSPAPASNNRYYAVWQRFGTFYGSAGQINIWDTIGPVGNETSIAQVAVIRGKPMQAIEAGKIELESLNGDKGPYFFTYYRTKGGASGDWVGGYNTLVDGWIQSSSTVAPGMSLAPWKSSTGGNQYSLEVEVRLHEGNWWVRVAGEWVGYYPYCKGGDTPPCDQGTLFSAAGIRDQASRLDWYGEVYDSSPAPATSTDMGSGAFASAGWQNAAYFRNLTYYWAPDNYWWWDSGSVTATDAECYSKSEPFYSSDDVWRNWFYYGGPGKEAAGCK